MTLIISTNLTEKAKFEHELKTIINEQDDVSKIILDLQKQTSEIEKKIYETANEIQKRQNELNDCKLLIDTLSNRLGRVENIKFIKQQFRERFSGIFRDCIIVHQGYEQIIDVCLYDTLNFFIVNDISKEDLSNIPEGRYGFMVKNEIIPETIPEDLKNLKPIINLIEIKSNREFLTPILSNFFLTSSFEESLKYAIKFPNYGFVTPDGLLLRNNAIVVQKGDFGYFQISQKLSGYQSTVESLQNEITFLNDEKRKLNEQHAEIKSKIEQNREHLLSLNIKKSELSMQLNTLKNQFDSLNKEIDDIDSEKKRLIKEIEDINNGISKYTSQIAENEETLTQKQSEKKQLEGITKSLESEIDDQNREINQIIMKLGILNEIKSVTENNISNTDTEIASLKNEIEEITKLSESEKLKTIEGEISNLKKEINEKKERRTQLETQIPEQIIQEISKRIDSIFDEITQFQKQHDEIQNAIMQVNFKVFELNHKKGELIKKAREDFQTDLNEYIPEEIPEPEQKLNEVKERMARIGEINPLSLSAYEQEKKRLDEFIAQRNDIITAKQNLLKSIAELDSRAHERFIETFKMVKEKFNEVFAKFFEGGEADLILADPANPLTSEIDIVVRMKGKKIKRINQLSGGERTLLAVSLLLAFYLVKPAPFCILDEIDAPLDDVNVVRFNKFLRELSQHTQVVIITHNRATMEFVDYIYGLTMEKPGKSKIISTRLEDLEPVGVEEQ